MQTVYIIQDPGMSRDFSSAAQYGKIVFLLDSSDRPSHKARPVLEKLENRLQNYTEDDYFIWAGGDPLSPILVGSVLSSLGFQQFRFLRWDRVRDRNKVRTGDGYYVPTVVNI